MKMAQRGFVTGRAIPLPGKDKPHYVISGGKTMTQVQRHIVRDAMTELRQDWKRDAAILKEAYLAEQRAQPSKEAERAERRRLKQEMAAKKQAYYQARQKQEAAERAAKKAVAAQFWQRKQQVLAEARKEMVALLTEDANLWHEHPREMMNRRFRTYQGKQWMSPFN